jgi:hypothetical protein
MEYLIIYAYHGWPARVIMVEDHDLQSLKENPLCRKLIEDPDVDNMIIALPLEVLKAKPYTIKADDKRVLAEVLDLYPFFSIIRIE